MFYKLSNTINVAELEDEFNVDLQYPLLFKKTPIINGLAESSLPIIKKTSIDVASLAIWGLLPQGYKEDWKSFQAITNTLNISFSDLDKMDWVKNIANQQKCIAVVSGFFTSYLCEGEIYPFYVYEKNFKPFGLAGIYSTLDDGFNSFSIITSPLENELDMVHNLGKEFPIALDGNNYKDWLNLDLSKKGISDLNKVKLQAHTVSKEFFKNEIMFDSILEPAQYSKLPVLNLR